MRAIATLAVTAATVATLPACREQAGRPETRAPRASTTAQPDGPRRSVEAHGQLGPGDNALFVDLEPPRGGSLTEGSPVEIVGHDSRLGLTFPESVRAPLSEGTLPLELPVIVADGATGPAHIDVSFYWCTEGERSSCVRERARLEVALDLSGSAAGGEAALEYKAPVR